MIDKGGNEIWSLGEITKGDIRKIVNYDEKKRSDVLREANKMCTEVYENLEHFNIRLSLLNDLESYLTNLDLSWGCEMISKDSLRTGIDNHEFVSISDNEEIKLRRGTIDNGTKVRIALNTLKELLGLLEIVD